MTEEEKCIASYEQCRAVLQRMLCVGAGDAAAAADGAAAGGAASTMDGSPETNTPGWSPLLPLLTGSPLTPEADSKLREVLLAHVHSGRHPAAFVNDLLALALRVQQLGGEMAKMEREKDLEIEQLKLRAYRVENGGLLRSADDQATGSVGSGGGGIGAGGGGGGGGGASALQKEFQQSEEVCRLEAQVEKLKRTVEFLREKKAVTTVPGGSFAGGVAEQLSKDGFEEYLETTGGTPIVVPSAVVLRGPNDQGGGDVCVPPSFCFATTTTTTTLLPTQEIDAVCAEIHVLLEAGDVPGLRRTLWVLVAVNAVLQARLTKAGGSVRSSVQRYNAVVHEAAVRRREYERVVAELQTHQRLDLEEARVSVMAEKSAVEVRLRLTLEELEQARAQLSELPEQHLNSAILTLQADESKFGQLYKKNKEMQSALGRLKVREDLLLTIVQSRERAQHSLQRLVAFARGDAAAELTEEDALHLQAELQQLELEDRGLVQQFQQLPPPPDGAAVLPLDQAETLAQAAVASTRQQLEALQATLEHVASTSRELYARNAECSVERDTLRFALEAETQLNANLKAEVVTSVDEKVRMQHQLSQQQQQEGREVHSLRDRLKQYEDLREEGQVCNLARELNSDGKNRIFFKYKNRQRQTQLHRCSKRSKPSSGKPPSSRAPSLSRSHRHPRLWECRRGSCRGASCTSSSSSSSSGNRSNSLFKTTSFKEPRHPPRRPPRPTSCRTNRPPPVGAQRHTNPPPLGMSFVQPPPPAH